MTRFLVFGAGGHAKVVIDAIESQDSHASILVFDDNPLMHGKVVMGHRVVGGMLDLQRQGQTSEDLEAVVAIGNNELRMALAEQIVHCGIPLATVVHRSAVVSRSAMIGPGSVVFANVAINAEAKIGANAIINTGATIEHDCRIADAAHIAPGVHLCGGVKVGKCTLIGVGSAVVPGVRIGACVVVGAGSTVLQDVVDNKKIAGTPAREL